MNKFVYDAKDIFSRCLCGAIILPLWFTLISRGQEGEACFDLFQASQSGNKYENGYLTLTASYFVYPAELGITELSAESASFQQEFEERFEYFGMTEFAYFHEESGFEFGDFLNGSDEIHHTDCVVMSNADAIIVVCRGSLPLTANPTNWITNLSFVSEDVTSEFESVIPNNWQEVWCHSGFWRAADSVYSQIKNTVSGLVAQDSRPVYLTGHSLGGALATIMGLRLHADGIAVKGIHTYAAPRVGDFGFANSFLNSGLMHHRWVNKNDPGPMMPPASFGYEHTGDEHFINRFTLDPHSCKEYAKGLWSELPYENRLIYPKWFESDWEWVTPEEEPEEPVAEEDPNDSSGEGLHPAEFEFYFEVYEPSPLYDTKDPTTKNIWDVSYPTKYSAVKSAEELEKEAEKLKYRYEEMPTSKLPEPSPRYFRK